MKYITVKQTADLWNLSERSVRNYCANGRIKGAVLNGKTWLIPESAVKPDRIKNISSKLTPRLLFEKEHSIKGGIYHKIQIELTFNSNHIEGSKLTHDQTRYIYETHTISLNNESINIDDIIETTNHFRCIDFIIDNYKKPLTESLIKKIHLLLKTSTSDSQKSWFNVGNYKLLENEVGGKETTKPTCVQKELSELLKSYNSLPNINLNDIILFHYKFECIHPFQDGNGRVGRLIMFKECLKNNITPFIIEDAYKEFYYRGLKEWLNDQTYLTDTILSAQDKFKTYLDYFKIKYTD